MKPVNIFKLAHEVAHSYSDDEIKFHYFNGPELQYFKIDENTNLEINKSEIYSQKIKRLDFNSQADRFLLT